ncbi:uncharacterized protein METZ01_LOCUS513665, partial [marine metagenome]
YGVEEDKLAVASAGCALYYVNQNFKGRIQHITSLSLLQKEGIMGLDAFTIRNLELFQSLSSQGIHGTLVGTIDKTVTAAGSRLLKNWLRQPLTDPEKINERLDRITEFIKDDGMVQDIQAHLKETADIERILARIASGKASPRDIINLGMSLERIPIVKDSIHKKNKMITKLLLRCADTDKITLSILNTVKIDPPPTTKKGGYIRIGFLPELDELRQLSADASQWMSNM